MLKSSVIVWEMREFNEFSIIEKKLSYIKFSDAQLDM